MSRLARKNLVLPQGVSVSMQSGRVAVRGPKGELSKPIPETVTIVENADKTISFSNNSSTLESKATLGTTVSHVKNMVSGVVTPFKQQLILEGIGFKSELSGDTLKLALGFSHPVLVKVPKGLTVTAEKNVITIFGIDREQVGSFAANLRSEKKPEPYKGKGFRYAGEVIRRKEGKKTV